MRRACDTALDCQTPQTRAPRVNRSSRALGTFRYKFRLTRNKVIECTAKSLGTAARQSYSAPNPGPTNTLSALPTSAPCTESTALTSRLTVSLLPTTTLLTDPAVAVVGVGGAGPSVSLSLSSSFSSSPRPRSDAWERLSRISRTESDRIGGSCVLCARKSVTEASWKVSLTLGSPWAEGCAE